MKKTDVIFNHWRAFKELTKGTKQEKYFASKIKNGKAVSCVSVRDVFTNDEIKKIRRFVRPQKRMCYKNAHLMALAFPDRVKYVEGEVSIMCGRLGIEHAWNLVDGKYYVDVTFEMALNEDVTQEGYVSIGVYDVDTINDVARETGVYGGIYENLYIHKLNKGRCRK